MASGRLTQHDIDHIFSVFDADKSGSISTEEYRTALIALGHGKVTLSEAAQMMDGRSSLNKEEFTETILKTAEQPNSMAEARRAFKLFDPKETGKITADLLLKAGLAATGSTPSLDLVNRILDACDQNGDGALDFDEFVAAVTIKLKLTPDPPQVAANTVEDSSSNNNNNGEEGEEGTNNNNNSSSEEQVSASTTTVAPAAGSSVRKILGKDTVFNENGLLSRKAARDSLILLGYPEDVLSDESLKDLFDEQDKDHDGFLTEEEYKELLTGLGEFE